jgi:hypothetical protein
MRREAIAIVLCGMCACASLTPQGKEVKVYQSEVAKPEDPAPPLPAGCKLVATSGPIEQQEQARHIYDPYLEQRNETATKGGNVLLVKSSRFLTLKKTECPESDARNCSDSAQNWYKVSFESYACDAPALAVLAQAKPAPESKAVFEWTPKKKSDAAPATAAATPVAAPATASAATAVPRGISAAELEGKVLALMHEGVGPDVIQSYVRANRLAAPLTAEEIIDWKKAGISDDVIRATFPN